MRAVARLQVAACSLQLCEWVWHVQGSLCPGSYQQCNQQGAVQAVTGKVLLVTVFYQTPVSPGVVMQVTQLERAMNVLVFLQFGFLLLFSAVLAGLDQWWAVNNAYPKVWYLKSVNQYPELPPSVGAFFIAVSTATRRMGHGDKCCGLCRLVTTVLYFTCVPRLLWSVCSCAGMWQ